MDGGQGRLSQARQDKDKAMAQTRGTQGPLRVERAVKEWLPEGHRDGWEKSGTWKTWLDRSVPAWGDRNGHWQPGPHLGPDPNHQPSTREPHMAYLEELDAYMCIL